MAASVMVGASGCMVAGHGQVGPNGGCAGVTGGACDEQLALIGARHPGATRVEITCGIAVCDRAHGAGTAKVTLANGTIVNDTFSYVGNGAPMPQPVCKGLAPAICTSLATQQFDSIPTQRRAVRIEVTCTSAPCTDDGGEADVKLLLDDGTTRDGSTTWQGGPP